jgi:hypothetical protein
MLIDCDTCRMRDVACGDCVISLLLGAPQDSLDLDAAALGALAAGGLAPPLRLVPVSRFHPPDVRWQRTRPGVKTSPSNDVPARRSSAGLRGVSPPTGSVSPPAVSGL